VAGLLINLALLWGALLVAGRIIKLIGLNGVLALSKIMAILLAAIAVMMIRLGMQGILAH
jgi:multiple antibiotic resistance protein